MSLDLRDKTPEDLRKTALKKGLSQLYPNELRRLIAHVEANKPILLDRDSKGHANLSGAAYCPLAIAVGVNTHAYSMFSPNKPYTDDDVARYLIEYCGFVIYNTRGIDGKFYTANRKDDLLTAAKEVLTSKVNQNGEGGHPPQYVRKDVSQS